jgi:hypothetical protein
MSLTLGVTESGAKAFELIRAGRVQLVDVGAVVRGEHDSYLVKRIEDRNWRCTCPWMTQHPDGKPCSHAVAACLTFLASRIPPKNAAAPAKPRQVRLPHTSDRCPECRAALLPGRRACSACGWIVPPVLCHDCGKPANKLNDDRTMTISRVTSSSNGMPVEVPACQACWSNASVAC